jgi:hypothetical protein
MGIDPNDLARFNAKFSDLASGGVLQIRQPMQPPPSYPDMEQCIRDTFYALFRSLAKYVAAFDCDLVIVTGKPSELPVVRTMLEDALPILPARIIFAKNHEAGDWYPMSRDGKITDAKTVTAVGAALYQAIQNGRIQDWIISRKTSEHLLVRNWWGQITVANPTDFATIYLQPDEGCPHPKHCVIPIMARIGRRLLKSASQPEQVYEFRWKDPGRRRGDHGGAVALTVQLKRVIPERPELGESLELAGVSGQFNGNAVTLEDVELKLNTLINNEFWMDTGRFEVRDPSVTRS